jgi:hypothetical protein
MNTEDRDYLQKLESRIVQKMQEDADCLIWTGRLSKSSGHPKYGDKVVRRVVWQAKHGPLKPGQLVTVTCGNPKCLEHLAITNKSEIAKKTNADPRVKAIKRIKSVALSRAKAKLDMQKAREIRASDLNNHEQAAIYGITHSMVSKIRTGKAWVEQHSNPFTGLGAR